MPFMVPIATPLSYGSTIPAETATNTVGVSTSVARADHIHGVAATQTATVALTTGDITTTSTSFADVAGVSVAMTTGANNVFLTCSAEFKGSAILAMYFDITDNGTSVTGCTGGLGQYDTPGANYEQINASHVLRTCTSGAHTFTLQWKVSSGTGTLRASTAMTSARLTAIEFKL